MFKKLSLLTAGLLLSVSVFANDVQDLIQKANNGDIQAQLDLADYYQGEKDYTNMFYWTQKLANQGDAVAQFNLGMMYYNGEGVHQDYAKAVEWYTKSANQGDAKAQNNLGGMYVKGQGVRQNYRTAKEWFGKACDNGNQKGCNNYRILNEQGY